ncbi:hypothetical protein [Streptomyces sp. NPDC088812]|uniref:hypothetical protein n=1 Tax=Streptomyces sp. NPDC088812 TaxID=3365905 RepID=UPI0037FA43A4
MKVHHLDAVLNAACPVPLRLDTDDRPLPRPSLPGADRASLAVLGGGGFTGLWTAVRARERRLERGVRRRPLT